MALPSGAWRGTRDKTSAESRQMRNSGQNPIYAGAMALPSATTKIISEKKDTVTRKYAVAGFLWFAFIINFILESRLKITRFNGFELEFFKSTVFGGDWIGIYNIFHFNIYFLLIVFAFFNLRDGKPHILRVWLSLILVTYILSSIPILNTYMGMRNFMEFFMLLFTTIYLSFAKHPTWKDFVATITLFWVFYNLWAFGVTATWGGFMHFIFIVLFYLTFCMGPAFEEDKTQIKWWLFIIILFDFLLPDFFGNIYPNLPIASLPFLFFGVLLFAQVYQPSKISIFFIIFFVTFYFFQFSTMGAAFREVIEQRQGDDADFEDRKNPFKFDYWRGLWKDMINQSMYYGSGQQYYESKVDENSKKKLGVYIEELTKNPREYNDNEQIVLDAILTAENFISDEEDPSFEPINIQLSCAAYKKDKIYTKGRIIPTERYEITSYDVENIQCAFEPWQLERGNYEIRVEATFNFETQAYLKRYFVSKEKIDSLRRKQLIKKDEDILKLNKIDDTNPISKNSVGPVTIEASERIPIIIKLDSENINKNLFGVQLENKWEGEIDKVKNIQFFIPEGVEIEKGGCSFHMKNYPIPDEKYEGYSFFKTNASNNPKLNDIEKAVEQKCWMVIDPSNIQDILQPGDVTTRYFRMIAEYDYTLEEKTNIEVKEQKGFNVKIVSANRDIVDSSSKIKCVAKRDEEINAKVTFILYKDDIEQEEHGEEYCSEETCEYTFNKIFERGANLRCEASYIEDDEGQKYTKSTIAYVTIKNSAPEIVNMALEPEEVKKGEKIVCKIETSDADDDNIKVRFDFEGINIASVQKDCKNSCQVEIPTDSIEETSEIICVATVYDDEGRGDEREETAQVIVETVESST